MPKEIYNSDPISLPQVFELLKDREQEGSELSYMQRIALEHADLVSRIEAKVATKLIDDLVEGFRLSDKGAITLANFLPDTIDEIRQQLGKEALTMETETIKEILAMLQEVPRRTKTTPKTKSGEDLTASPEMEEEKIVDEEMIPEDLRLD